MNATSKDIENAKRIPERWTALGAIGFPSATARRLLRLGLIERRLAPRGLCRLWDYRRVSPPPSSDTAPTGATLRDDDNLLLKSS